MTEPFRITEPGLYTDVPPAIYHADPCPVPSLSSSIAKTILDMSPAHARQQHVRLTPQEPKKPNVDRDIGSACHALVFGGEAIELVDATGWTKKADQETRALCYAEGRIPLLTKDYDRASRMADIVRPMIVDRLGSDFLPEAVIAWKHGEHAWCRTALDAVSTDLTRWVDLKTSGGECDKIASVRRFYSESSDIQCGFQSRGLDAVNPPNTGRRSAWFIYVENDAPFGATPIKITETMMAQARRKARVATEMWRISMELGDWPNYPTEDVTPEMPPWAEQDWMRREMEDKAVRAIVDKFGTAIK